MTSSEQPPAVEDSTVIRVDFIKNKTPQGAEDQTRSELVTPMSQEDVKDKLGRVLSGLELDNSTDEQASDLSNPKAWEVLPLTPPDKRQ